MEELVRKTIGTREFILVGTKHISLESAALVQKVITEEQPSAVCIELDDQRFENMKDANQWQNLNIIQVIKEKKAPMLIMKIVYAALQKKMAKELDTKPGVDMQAAIDTAEAHDIPLWMVDRNVNTTFTKIWRSMSFGEKMKFIYAFFGTTDELEAAQKQTAADSTIEELLDSDMLDTLFANLKEKLPNFYHQMIEERNQYIATKSLDAPGDKVVIVMGKGHLTGVAELLGQRFDLAEIERIPEKKLSSRIISWAFPAILAILIGYGFLSGVQEGLSHLSTWLLWNCGLSALFTIFAGGHPLTILAAFIFAPLGTFSPVLSVGMFSGIVEAFVRKPQVKDFELITDDLFTLKMYWKNKALRVLTVFVLSSLGGALGNLIAGWGLLRNLF